MNKMSIKSFYIIVFTILLLPNTVWGDSTVRTGEMVTVSPDQVVEDDFYGLGNSVLISGEVTSDLLTAGGDTTINGKIGADVTSISVGLDIHGVVEDDVRAIAAEVLIDGEIKGDLVVLAKSLKILPTAKIDGDILFFGSIADISGFVGGNIFGSTNESMRIDAEVKGDVDIDTTLLTLGDKTNIAGGVKYESFSEVIRAQNSHVTNDVVRSDPVFDGKENSPFKDIIIVFLILAFTSLVGYLLFRNFLQRIVTSANSQVFRNSLIGFLVLFILPIIALVLMFSVLGSLIGGALLVTYVLLIIMSLITMSVVAGSFIARTAKKTGEVSIVFILLGSFFVIALLFVPIVGKFILIGLLLITLGAITSNLYKFLRG